jgi:endonuclease YncB( thermonuclease family)
MKDLAYPIASVLLGLAVVAFFLWPVFMQSGSEENRLLPNRSAQVLGMNVGRSLSKPGIPTKKALLAREKAEADRFTALQKRDEIEFKPNPTTKTYYRVTVPDSGTLEAGELVIKLDGIVARPADAQCQDEKGKSWPCGAEARAALRRMIRARAVVCALPETAEQKSFTTRCAVSGTDLSTWMVRQGWAKPNDPPEPALADAASAAKSEHIGIWRGVE